jgi:type I restriction enzyme S subunit
MRNVSQANLRVLRLPLPRLEEQVSVAKAIGALDERAKAEAAALSATRNLKDALMSVLLTGELRVKPEEGAA